MVLTNCAEGTLTPYSSTDLIPWNEIRAAHLFRRIGFGGNLTQRTNALDANPLTLIDTLIENAAAAPFSSAPEWAFWNFGDYSDFQSQSNAQIIEWLKVWFDDFNTQPLRGKMTLFWSNHFVTELNVYNCPSYLYQYHRVLQEYAYGNFKDFVRAIGLTPAMLVYLNGAENGKDEPNENYARELYELFSLGADNNYTQTDIEETARALTGYTEFETYCGTISFDSENHDSEPKTIFGQTGNWDYDDVIDILFEQRSNEIANFICEKLYKFFVHPEPVSDIIEGLAATFITENWEIKPVLLQLFKSEHFFDKEVMQTVVRSPYDFILSLKNEVDYDLPDTLHFELIEFASFLGQTLGSPVNVAGWQGNRTWISSSLLTARWQAGSYISYAVYLNEPEKLVDLAVNLTSTDETNPDTITRAIVDYLIPGGLTNEGQYNAAIIVFRAEVPEYYYDTSQWNLAWETVAGQVALLIEHISRMPEAQLM